MRRAVPALLFVIAACGHAETPAPAPAPPTATAKPAPASPATKPQSEDERSRAAAATIVGMTPPEWKAERWMNSPPLTLASLRGSVVLVRWWTSGCPFCAATAPSLRSFNRTYADKGLKVIGLYHHKEETPFDPKVYEETAKKYEFTFPIAVDPEWHTLKAWMRDRNGQDVDTGFTSVTFVLDKHGVVRHVHPGGQYVAGDPGYAELQSVIERLLAES